jgi:hypothetical protein
MPTKSTCQPNPHANQIHMPTKSTCQPNPHANQIHIAQQKIV